LDRKRKTTLYIHLSKVTRTGIDTWHFSWSLVIFEEWVPGGSSSPRIGQHFAPMMRRNYRVDIGAQLHVTNYLLPTTKPSRN